MKREFFGFIAAMFVAAIFGTQSEDKVEIVKQASAAPAAIDSDKGAIESGGAVLTAIELQEILAKLERFDKSVTELAARLQSIDDRLGQQDEDIQGLADEFLGKLVGISPDVSRIDRLTTLVEQHSDQIQQLLSSQQSEFQVSTSLKKTLQEQEEIEKQLAWSESKEVVPAEAGPAEPAEEAPAEEPTPAYEEIQVPVYGSQCYIGVDGRRYCRQVQTGTRTVRRPLRTAARVTAGTAAAVVRSAAAAVGSGCPCNCGCPGCTCSGVSVSWADDAIDSYSSDYSQSYSGGCTGMSYGYSVRQAQPRARVALFPRLRFMFGR